MLKRVNGFKMFYLFFLAFFVIEVILVFFWSIIYSST